MAYTAGNLTLLATGNGFSHYRYDTTDVLTTVETAGYFNNKDDNLNLAIGDKISVFVWSTAVRTGTMSLYGDFVVTSVISNDSAVSAGNVDIAEIGVSTSGAISSGN